MLREEALCVVLRVAVAEVKAELEELDGTAASMKGKRKRVTELQREEEKLQRELDKTKQQVAELEQQKTELLRRESRVQRSSSTATDQAEEGALHEVRRTSTSDIAPLRKRKLSQTSPSSPAAHGGAEQGRCDRAIRLVHTLRYAYKYLILHCTIVVLRVLLRPAQPPLGFDSHTIKRSTPIDRIHHRIERIAITVIPNQILLLHTTPLHRPQLATQLSHAVVHQTSAGIHAGGRASRRVGCGGGGGRAGRGGGGAWEIGGRVWCRGGWGEVVGSW